MRDRSLAPSTELTRFAPNAADVDSTEASACCYGRDIIFVKVQGETPPMMPVPDNPNAPSMLINQGHDVRRFAHAPGPRPAAYD